MWHGSAPATCLSDSVPHSRSHILTGLYGQPTLLQGSAQSAYMSVFVPRAPCRVVRFTFILDHTGKRTILHGIAWPAYLSVSLATSPHVLDFKDHLELKFQRRTTNGSRNCRPSHHCAHGSIHRHRQKTLRRRRPQNPSVSPGTCGYDP